ncbi:MAG: putative sulfate exporter family transporter [Firmicutes bacterium]|nr:putative sulfate exporter family transporter [Bacillota bacterium]
MNTQGTTLSEAGPEQASSKELPWHLASLILVGLLAAAAWWLNKTIPSVDSRLKVLEYPVYAVALGLAANLLTSLLGIRARLALFFRTEFFLKTGLVLLGATVNIAALVAFGVRGILQALILITGVFFFTWWLAGLFKIDSRLRAVISASVSICGVSAAISAAGAVLAKKEQLAYVTGLVILFALPLMFLQPAAANWLGLDQEVAGAWIGGNIDTTAAVTGAGAIAGEEALKVASIVKMSQNALIGVVAFLLALYWVVVVEKTPGQRPSAWQIWERFPKFVLGFVLASVTVSLGLSGGWVDKSVIKSAIQPLRDWFFMAAFLSIGFGLSFSGLKEAGWRPILIYGVATIFNTGLALLAASLIFG